MPPHRSMSAFYAVLVHQLAIFSYPSFPESVTLSELASDSSMFIFFMFGIPTGDFNPIYNVPMLGTHKACEATGDNVSS